MRRVRTVVLSALLIGCSRDPAPTPTPKPDAKPAPAAKTPLWQERIRSRDAGERLTAAQESLGIGPEAVPVLIDALDDDDWGVRWTAADLLARRPEHVALAVPKLTTALGRWVAQMRSAGRLKAVDIPDTGGRVVSATVSTSAGNEDRYACQYAVIALGIAGPKAKPAAPVLVDLLPDTDPNLRGFTVETLRKIGAVSELLDVYRTKVWTRKRNAHDVEPFKGAGADEAAALGRIVRDADMSPHVRNAAFEALGRLGAKAKPAVGALVEILADPASEHAVACIGIVAAVGPEAVDAVPALLGVLKAPDRPTRFIVDEGDPNPIPTVHQATVGALGRIGPAAKAAVADLTQVATSHADVAVRKAAEAALKAIAPTPPANP